MQAVFDVRRQQLGIGVFPGIGFQQQGLQHRLVRRIDALVQLPQAGAEILFRRQRTQAAEIQPLVRRQRALRVQRQHVFIVVRFFFARHHVPQDAFAGQAHRGAVEFVEQQDMLRRAAVFAAQAAAFIMAEAVFVDQEEADFHPIEAAHFSSRLHFCCRRVRSSLSSQDWWQTQMSRSELQLWPIDEVLPIE